MPGSCQLEGLPFCREDADNASVLEERDDAGVRDGSDEAGRVFDRGTNVRISLNAGPLVAPDGKDAEA